MNKVQHVERCMKQTNLTSEISYPTDSCLAQLARYWPEDLEVLVSNPTGGNFRQFFFCSSLCKDLSDNLTETPIVKTQVCLLLQAFLVFYLHGLIDAFKEFLMAVLASSHIPDCSIKIVSACRGNPSCKAICWN